MTSTTRLPLTARQQEILAWLAKYIADHGYSPTIRELCLAFGFASTQGAMCHLEPLRKKGWITWNDGQARTLRVLEEVADGL
jgi:repressor LexA